MRTISKYCLALGLIAASVVITPYGATAADPEYKLRLGWTNPDGENDPYAISGRMFKEGVERRSGGRIAVELYPNRAIGDERQLVDGMRMGTVEMGVITNAVISQIEPAFKINDLPFLFPDAATAHRVLDGETGEELNKRLSARGITLLGFMEGGFRHMLNNQKPVSEPSDVEGVKFRVMQSPMFIDVFTRFGGTAVPMTFGETFTAVQQGAVDGLELPLGTINSAKYYEITKYLSLTKHVYSALGLLISNRTLKRMPEDLQTVVHEAAREAIEKQRQRIGAIDNDLAQMMARQGMQVNEVADISAFRELIMPMYDALAKEIGSEFVQSTLNAARN